MRVHLWFFHSFAGLFLECPGVTSVLLKTNLQHIQAPIQSLSIYDFDRTITALTNDLFASSSPNGLQIKHLQFSNSNIQMLKDNSLINLRDSLESLSIVNGKLTNVSKHSGCHRLLQINLSESSENCNWTFKSLQGWLNFIEWESEGDSSSVDSNALCHPLTLPTVPFIIHHKLPKSTQNSEIYSDRCESEAKLLESECMFVSWSFITLRFLTYVKGYLPLGMLIRMAITIKNESYYRINYDFYGLRRHRVRWKTVKIMHMLDWRTSIYII